MCLTGMHGELLEHRLGDVLQVLAVVLGDQDRRDARAVGREDLLLEAADRQHAAAQRDLAGHRDRLAHRDAQQRGRHRGRHRDARATGRPSGSRPRGSGRGRRSCSGSRSTARTCRRASAGSSSRPARDSCMTSPSLPVSVSLPLPGTIVTSAVRRSPPNVGDREAVGEADLVFLLAARLAVLLDAEPLGELVGRDLERLRPRRGRRRATPWRSCGTPSRSRARSYGRPLPSCSDG